MALVLAGGGHEGGALVGGHGAGGAPLDAALAIDEQDDDLFVVGDGEVVEELFAVDPERDDPVEHFGIGLVAAHGRSFPPAEEEVFALGDGKLVITQLKIGVLQRLGGGEPGIDVALLLFLEGDEEQVELAFELTGQRDFLFVEAVGSDRGKDGLLLRLCGEARQRRRAREKKGQQWDTLPQ